MSGQENRYSSWATKNSTRTPQLREEKLLEEVLRKQGREKIITSLSAQLGRKPSEEEIENVFQLTIGMLRDSGVLVDILNGFNNKVNAAAANKKS